MKTGYLFFIVFVIILRFDGLFKGTIYLTNKCIDLQKRDGEVVLKLQ